ncbi:MAG: hypothetical protein ACFE9T_11665 [Promethearchaeota archaeon]
MGKKNLGFILSAIAIIGVIISIIFQILVTILLLIFCVLLVIGVYFLSMGMIDNNVQKYIWIMFGLTAIMAIVAFFTPIAYNLGIQDEDVQRDFAWLWDLPHIFDMHSRYVQDFYTLALFYAILILIVATIIIIISIIIRNNYTKFNTFGMIFKTISNILIISPIAIYGTMFIAWGFEATAGFALVGPFFAGIMLKVEYKRIKTDSQLNKIQIRKNKIGFAPTINGANILLYVGVLIHHFEKAFRDVMSNKAAEYFVILFKISFIIVAVIAYLSMLSTFFKPSIGFFLFLISGAIAIAFTTMFLFITIQHWLRILAIGTYGGVLLLIWNVNKLRELVRLEKNK